MVERHAGAEVSDKATGLANTTEPEIKAPRDIELLISREHAAELGHGPELTMVQKEHLKAWRTFPDPKDDNYRALFEKEQLFKDSHHGPNGGSVDKSNFPPLNREDSALLHSKLEFPNDVTYRKLAERDALDHANLSVQEQALLQSKRKFMQPEDEPYRKLAEKRFLYEHNEGPKLTTQELFHLASKEEYPKDDQRRELQERHLLGAAGLGPKLSNEELSRLEQRSPK